MVAVMRWRSTASNQVFGLNDGRATKEPPRSRTGTQNAAAAWLNGVHSRKRSSSGHSHSAIWIWVSAADER